MCWYFFFQKIQKRFYQLRDLKIHIRIVFNGIGGKIEEDESAIDAAIRETKEETNINLNSPKLFITYTYPKSNSINSQTTLNVVYDFVDVVNVKENEEGVYKWKNISCALDFNNRELAGFANISQFIKEIYDLENIEKFYEK